MVQKIFNTITSRRILVVDDDPIAQHMHKNLLEGAGYEVIIAHDGAHAVALTKEQNFAVICMDVNMPGMDGLEATALIRAQENPTQRAAIIGITSYDDAKHKHCLARGMTAILNKPVQLDELMHMVREYMSAI